MFTQTIAQFFDEADKSTMFNEISDAELTALATSLGILQWRKLNR